MNIVGLVITGSRIPDIIPMDIILRCLDFIINNPISLAFACIVYFFVGFNLAVFVKEFGYPKWVRFASLTMWPIVITVTLTHFILTVLIPEYIRKVVDIFRA